MGNKHRVCHLVSPTDKLPSFKPTDEQVLTNPVSLNNWLLPLV